MTLPKHSFYLLIPICLFSTHSVISQSKTKKANNPFLQGMNVPVDYAKVTSEDVADYAKQTIADVTSTIATLKKQKTATFANVFGAMDDIKNKMGTASNNCFMLNWVSADSIIRTKGLVSYQLLDSLSTVIYSDKGIYKKMKSFKESASYKQLKGNKRYLVDDMIEGFERSGVNLNSEQLTKYKNLTKEIGELSSSYSNNMNASKEILSLDEKGADGLPEDFKNNYKVADGKYEIPIINATSETVLNNATAEETRKAYYIKFYDRAADKNLAILDSMVKKRDELAKLMGYPTYAAYALVPKMASNPKTVWNFLNDLVSRSKEKAKSDVSLLEIEKKVELAKEDAKLQPWDIGFYKNQIIKKQYQINNEELRAYFPMDKCLKGMMDIYQKLLGFEFRKVQNPSVWHEEVEMYEVFESGKLKGRFYLDLFPRPNKETWFYGVNIVSGKGKEIPVSMLLGNFTRPSKTQPSLLSQKELNTLFHEFGHIMNMMSYHGEFSSQQESKSDFTEAMSQIFENWILDYDVLSTFAKNYKTGEVLPKATFDNMIKSRKVGSGLASIQKLVRCLYDMNLYDKYNAAAPVPSGDIWKTIDKQLGVMDFYSGTHYQANWIHVNTHPVYMYGYLWSEVYALDMFTAFEKNGLKDTKTGVSYRELILANGTQSDIVKAVEKFLGRPSNNKAYIKSLGLE
ncbi:M3 family metallopeptidase [Flavobacterium paronense]|uniref:M3 family metallopeptidase n=1 Tax=Flavobacterium paronense TaxID=1392775 RepID=A0ABV5GGY0_9FLAO|nr:M3 family metallopeptidase [Flavobacterium paronense]MDN3677261.1 M3 family metallopeptidase [Flavobacterium paronense]